MELIAVTLIVALVGVSVAIPYIMARTFRAMQTDIAASTAHTTSEVAEAIGKAVQTALAPSPVVFAERPDAEGMPTFEYKSDVDAADLSDPTDRLLEFSADRQDAVLVNGDGHDPNEPWGIPGLRIPGDRHG